MPISTCLVALLPINGGALIFMYFLLVPLSHRPSAPRIVSLRYNMRDFYEENNKHNDITVGYGSSNKPAR